MPGVGRLKGSVMILGWVMDAAFRFVRFIAFVVVLLISGGVTLFLIVVSLWLLLAILALVLAILHYFWKYVLPGLLILFLLPLVVAFVRAGCS
jgi:hypothetical protein